MQVFQLPFASKVFYTKSQKKILSILFTIYYFNEEEIHLMGTNIHILSFSLTSNNTDYLQNHSFKNSENSSDSMDSGA